MNRREQERSAQRPDWELIVFAALAVGCSGADAAKSWDALSSCLAGPAAKQPLVTRVQVLRRIQLANAGAESGTVAKDGWPGRCAKYADELYAALPTSGTGAVMKRKLGQRAGCSDEKGSCKLSGGSAVLGLTTELWDAAKDSGLVASGAATGVPVPEALPAPVLNAASWKSFSAKPQQLAGPAASKEGRAFVLLKSAEGRMRPMACEFTEAFAKVRCFEASAKVPELPAHSLEVVHDERPYAAGLTEQGLVAFDLETGEQSAVRGRSRRLVRDGVAVEPAAKDEVPSASAKPDLKEEGFVAVELKDGKVLAEVKLPTANAVGDPVSGGSHVAWLRPSGAGAELHVMSLANRRLKPETTITGKFSGPLRVCAKGDEVSVASFGSRAGLQNAKPSAGADATQLTVASFRGGEWSKALESTLPFARAFESDLVCTGGGASLVWTQSVEGGVRVGRIDCRGQACDSKDVTLPGVESKWWWAAAPLGPNVLLLWRSGLGETRLRVAPLAELASAKDTLVFDAPDFGGPNAGELSLVVSDAAALLLFRGEQPVALRIASDGAVRLLAP